MMAVRKNHDPTNRRTSQLPFRSSCRSCATTIRVSHATCPNIGAVAAPSSTICLPNALHLSSSPSNIIPRSSRPTPGIAIASQLLSSRSTTFDHPNVSCILPHTDVKIIMPMPSYPTALNLRVTFRFTLAVHAFPRFSFACPAPYDDLPSASVPSSACN